mgnify:CR=1 FL=1
MDKKPWTNKRAQRRQAHNVFATTLEVAASAAATLVLVAEVAISDAFDLPNAFSCHSCEIASVVIGPPLAHVSQVLKL